MSTVLRVDPRADIRWHALAAGAGGSLFISPPWISAISATYGFVPEARVALDDAGHPVAGTVWMDVHDLRGSRRLTLPFCDRADPVVAHPEDWTLVAADALAGDIPFTLRCLDTSPATEDPRLHHVGEAAWHVTPLDRPLGELYDAFGGSARRNIATAHRRGVKVHVSCDLGAVMEFHRIHVELRKRKFRLLAQPQEFFQQIWSAFAPSDGIRTLLAMVDGHPVAGAIGLVWGDTLYYKFGASRSEALPLCPNEAVHWELIRWAHERGLRAMDWGLSDLDQPGLCAYKSKWATVEGRIRTLNAGGQPVGRSAEVDGTLHSITGLFTEPSVPDDVTARAGATLYRFFC